MGRKMNININTGQVRLLRWFRIFFNPQSSMNATEITTLMQSEAGDTNSSRQRSSCGKDSGYWQEEEEKYIGRARAERN